METRKNRRRMLAFAVRLAAALVMAFTAVGAAQEPTAGQPTVEATAPPSAPEQTLPPASVRSAQKDTEEPSKAGVTEKKKGPVAFMLLGLFAVITGHQGTTR